MPTGSPLRRSGGSWARSRYSFLWSSPSRSPWTGRVPQKKAILQAGCCTRHSWLWHLFLPMLPLQVTVLSLLLPAQGQHVFSEHLWEYIPLSSPNFNVPFALLELCDTSLRLTRKAALTAFYLQKWEQACCLGLGEKTSRAGRKVSSEKTR